MHHNPTGYGKKNVHCPTGSGQKLESEAPISISSPRYWSFRIAHKVFMLTLSRDGGSIQICERTRFTGYEISLLLDAAIWLLEEVEWMIDAKDYLKADRRTFRNYSMRLLLEWFKNVRGVFLKLSVLNIMLLSQS